jgi:hypothetical protein
VPTPDGSAYNERCYDQPYWKPPNQPQDAEKKTHCISLHSVNVNNIYITASFPVRLSGEPVGDLASGGAARMPELAEGWDGWWRDDGIVPNDCIKKTRHYPTLLMRGFVFFRSRLRRRH